jgi:nucleoside-diphosphate-sugar epimerase
VARVLVAGGTGVLGAYLLPRLLRAGHDVTALARTVAGTRQLAAAGVTPALADVFDADAVRRAAQGNEVVIHGATRIPRVFPGRPADFTENDRIRRDGTRNLLAAAAAGGARRFVLQSIVWVHGDPQGAWIDEEATLQPGAIARSAVDAEAMAREASAHHGFAVDILRCGAFYAAEAFHTREILERLRHRTAPIIGRGENYQCFVHAADVAEAFARAAEATIPGDTYFVTDDAPVPIGEYLTWLARVIGAPAPLHIPQLLARLTLGPDMANAYGASLRCRTDRIKRQLGWAPRYPTFRDGYAEVLARLGPRAPSSSDPQGESR